MIKENVTLIEKEAILGLSFTDLEVLSTEVERNIRARKLYRAMLLGNNYKHKTHITFSTANGINRVNTTIWALTEQFVILKGGILIPVNTVWDVQ